MFIHGATAPSRPWPPDYRGFNITLRHNTLGKIPLIDPSHRRLPDNTQHSQQIPIPPAGIELAIPASKRPQTHGLDRAANGIGKIGVTSPITEPSHQLSY
jgi:hypothetical protein